MAAGIFNKLKKLVQVVGKGVNWMNDKIVKPIMPITNALHQSFGPTGSRVAKEISAGSSAVNALFDISDALASQTAAPYVMPINFSVSIPLDDLLIFSVFSEFLNALIVDLKIKFKINPQTFVFCQIDLIISMVKYYTINKDELLSSSKDKLKDIGLLFRNWFLTFQYANMFTQIGYTVDLITEVRAEELTASRLKNLVCDIKRVTISVRNYIIIAAVANMCGYKASEICLNRVQQSNQSRTFVVPAQHIETWAFPSAASSAGIKATQIYLYLMLLISNILDNIFEACDEYEDSFATPSASKTRRYNPVSDYTSFFITIQCEHNSNRALTFDGQDTQNQNISIELKGHPIFAGDVDTYYNVDTNGKHPLPPILSTVHDTFWLFSPRDGGFCLYDTIHSFDQVIDQIIA
ncbi:MAG: hypothetical protein EZS28_001803 [Streblomastix strix]|uniref:Uncharacterized protein n=1 Tax=Streblomastix strix TaxID=222440 RepID=A0A5J4X6L5_9EUKA|nr:MAG: hypothetical protein EZS28_001803 [Streblomastix strix]